MRRQALMPVFFLTLSGSAVADEWAQLDQAEIINALSAQSLAYPDGAWQKFFADGRTIYQVPNGESWGQWWAEGDKYCSTWPPSKTPACYLVAMRGLEVRFTASNGQETIGQFAE